MSKNEFSREHPCIANRLELYTQSMCGFERTGDNRYMRSAESDWSMAAAMAERADIDLLGAATLFGISGMDDPLFQLSRACRAALGKPMISAA